MKDQHELETMIRSRLDEIRPVPPRDPQIASRARAQFLGKAVSANEFKRRKGWNSIFRKEQFAMNMLISLLVIAGLLFGGGATVNAAQDDLPNEPLYALKIWSEDISLQFRNNPEAKVEQLMELAQIRIQEMAQLMEDGQTPPDQVQLRLEQHIQQVLQICSNLDDAALDQTLLQLRDRLQQQDRDMEKLQIHTTQDVQPILDRTRTMLRERLQLIEEGLLNHEMFRYTVQSGFRFGQEEKQTPPVQNGQQNGQPTSAPGGPSIVPGGPNTDPGGTSTGPGEPNPNPSGPNTTDPGGSNPNPGEPNTNPGGTSTGPGGNTNDSGSGSGGGGSGGNGK